MPWWRRSSAQPQEDQRGEPALRPHWTPPPSPRYYLYVSDSKLDMLAGQIPRGRLDGLAAELQIDLKVISVSLREAPSDETRYSKLALVEAHLQEQESIGPVDAPSAYFDGTFAFATGVSA
jgi:hypothetical protein